MVGFDRLASTAPAPSPVPESLCVELRPGRLALVKAVPTPSPAGQRANPMSKMPARRARRRCAWPGKAVAAAVLLMAPLLAAAQGLMPFVEHFSFGMVALGPDQVARLSLVNIAQAGSTPACVVDIDFVDGEGRVLKSDKASLGPQKSALSELDYRDIAGSKGRVLIRAVFGYTLPVTQGVLAPGSVCTIVPTLEISDRASGKPEVVLSDTRLVPLRAFPPSLPSRQ